MFDWLKKLFVPDRFQAQDESWHADESEIQFIEPKPKIPAPTPYSTSVDVGPKKPRTLAAELENKHLQRPLLFEPALRQYQAFRAGEPVFENKEEGERWYKLRNHVLQHVLMQICQSEANQNLILRGSALMSIWFGQKARRPGDLDWVVTPDNWTYESRPAERLVRTVENSLRGTKVEGDNGFLIPDRRFVSDDIWTYEKAPGKRLIVPWECVDSKLNGTIQMDLVFGEFMPSPAVLVDVGVDEGRTMQLACATPEQSLAWKISWLENDSYGQGKDLYDAVLLAEHSTLDAELLRATFEHADTWSTHWPNPITKFNADTIRNWYIEWDDFQKEYPVIVGDVQSWQERLIRALGPLFDQLGA